MPPNDVFSQDELDQSKSSNITSGISDSVQDGVEETLNSQQAKQQIITDATQSQASENLQYVLQPNEYLSFSQERIISSPNDKLDSQRGNQSH